MLLNALYTLALASAASATCMHGTTLMRREEGHVPVSNFTYSGERGPLNWAGLTEANSACRASKVQSPIVLDDTVSKAASVPQVSIHAVEEAEFENLGSTLEVVVSGTTVFEDKTYRLKQFHLHTPSEHRINEEYFPLEMHMVHQAEDESILVLAVPFQLSEDGSTTALLTSTIAHLDQVTEPGTATQTGPLDFAPLISAVQAGPLFQYAGSLTTPPCAEGVTFLVLAAPLPLDVKTYNALKKVIKFNARYTQNTPGAANLLEVVVETALAQDPSLGGGAACEPSPNGSTHEGSTESNVDVHVLIEQLIAGGHNLKFDTVTKTTTVVTAVVGSDSSSDAPHSPGPVVVGNPGKGHVEAQLTRPRTVPSAHRNPQTKRGL